MEARPATTSTTTTNPPSVEIAYKRKCAALKKRLAEVEAENDLMRTRNLRGYQYIQKMRLESCMLLERLAKVTGMADEAAAGKADPELRARAAAMMSNVSALNEVGAGEQVADGVDLDDETEGSSDEQPPTPEERPLRIKRSRKSNIPLEGGDEDNGGQENAGDAGGDGDAKSSSLPRLAPAPSQKELTSSFRVRKGSDGAQDSENGADADHQDANSEARAGDAAEDDDATPMDVDDKEPKDEQG
ncbi:hypothetical protein POX_e07231 [Penicillium oxalicum]|uniref:INO80 complex subunit F domain-containing protein n=1 Tax=Penicillium oxalicum (strain 114-2 / CGMCC 5302) TaxID=933388 RepID=S7ZCA3_PENO1|nr:hypothetical protein POX_e07231 [Penicillium oxalicum]EPS28260.1 hypothetical protein PDE_03206 [Penicillium oxalicum 114-2]KAI2789201.1 hypothetical protein POX_e07231 [Penicillium oxalicum]